MCLLILGDRELFCARNISDVPIFQLSIHWVSLDSMLKYQNILVFLSPVIAKMQF